MGETFVMDELRVRVGDERVAEDQRQQQNRLERAVATHGLNEEHFDTLLVRLNNVEQLVQTNHAAVISDINSFRLTCGQQISTVARAVSEGLKRVSLQAPHQLWHTMDQQQQHRVQTQATLRADQQGRVVLAASRSRGTAASGNDNGRELDEENRNPQRPSNHRGPAKGPLLLGASLMAKPNSLYELWQEYQFGVGGRKPAKDFSSKERGRCKSTYCRRKYFWDLVEKHIACGYTHITAIDRILGVYTTSLSVTETLKRIRQDIQNGGHPGLRL